MTLDKLILNEILSGTLQFCNIFVNIFKKKNCLLIYINLQFQVIDLIKNFNYIIQYKEIQIININD